MNRITDRDRRHPPFLSEAAKRTHTQIDRFSEIYQAVPCEVFPAGNGSAVILTCTGEQVTLPSHLAHLIAGCNVFLPIAEHGSRLWQRQAKSLHISPWSSAGDLIDDLTRLAAAGLLLSGRQVFEYCRAVQEDRAVPSTSVIVVSTSGRCASLRNCIETYSLNFKYYGRHPEYLVFCNCPSAYSRTRVIATLSELGKAHELSIKYSDMTEKKRFLSALARFGGFDPRVLEFALLDVGGRGYSQGANRNAALLETDGELCIYIDEDTVCDIAPPDQVTAAVRFDHRSGAPEFFQSFRDPDSFISTFPAPVDLLGSLERYLGKRLTSCVAALEQYEEFQAAGLDCEDMENLLTGRGRIVTTVLSRAAASDTTWGPCPDLGEAGARPNAMRQGVMFGRSTGSQAGLGIVRAVTVRRCPLLSSEVYGVDNRLLLPPFMPSVWCEEYLFASLLRLCAPHSRFAHLPMAPSSQPTVGECSVDECSGDQWRRQSVRLVESLLCDGLPHSVNEATERRLRRAGQYLMELSATPPVEFEYCLRLDYFRWVSRRLSELDNLSQELSNARDPRGEDVLHNAAMLKERSVEDKSAFMPVELSGIKCTQDALSALQHSLHCFGRLLCQWPDIVAATHELREKEIHATRDNITH